MRAPWSLSLSSHTGGFSETHISIWVSTENAFALFETWSSTFIPVYCATAGPLGSRCAVGAVAF